jgi:prolyl-tRNA synthetase
LLDRVASEAYRAARLASISGAALMRMSQLFLKTYYEDPADAEVQSHKLLARGGFLVKTGAGIYTLTPLLWRVVRKIMRVVCEEMDRAGAQEILMPIIQPVELWQESGRLDNYLKANILFHLVDRKGAKLALGPTHEEVVTDLVRRSVSSHKDLGFTLYQQQMKFRDEIRPRFGLMRGREFMMKDAYSFDADADGLDLSYNKMAAAYHRIFTRLGLRYVVVDADSGAIGGSKSQEFMVTADSGEDELLLCSEAGYGANVEKADSVIAPAEPGGDPQPLRKEPTPGVKTVEQLCEFFGLGVTRMVKTVLYQAVYKDETRPVAVLMRGDRAVNEVKLQNYMKALAVEMCDDAAVRHLTGADPGFAGPIGLSSKIKLVADKSVEGLTNFLSGGNATDFHWLNVNYGRDFATPEFLDLRTARPGDGCVLDAQRPLTVARGIEVGHIFKLGTKYSEAMGAKFVGKDGKTHPIVMGCYGIGSTRVAAASVEQNNDKDGIIWPWAMAPYHAVVMASGKKDAEALAGSEALYSELLAKGYEALLDDRDMGVGARMKDAELIGIPFRILFGRGWKEQKVEIKCRRTGEVAEIAASEVQEWIEKRKA